jgi:hypothetical protein
MEGIKEMKKTLEQLEDEYNSHPRESGRLLLLCNNDLSKLESLYDTMRVNSLFKIPVTNHEVNEVLKHKQ